MKKNKFNQKLLVLFLTLAATSLSYSQIRVVQSGAVLPAIGSSAFIDASSNNDTNPTSNLGKGLLFPRTDLSRFTSFGGVPVGIPESYPTFYDGMIVYNIKSGGKAGIGETEGELTPGFWYYDNRPKSGTTQGINSGIWKKVSSPTTNQLTLSGNTLTSNVNGVTSSIDLPASNGVDNPANNGLSKDGTTIQLGGNLLKDTSVELNDKSLNFTGAQGRIGVGTNNPLSKFNIQGGALSIGGLTNYSGGLQVVNQNADRAIVRVYSSDNTERFTIQENGNIGIGTNDPTRKLDVDGNIRIRQMVSGSLGDDDRILSIEPDGNVKKVNIARVVNVGNIGLGSNDVPLGSTEKIAGINVTIPAGMKYRILINGKGDVTGTANVQRELGNGVFRFKKAGNWEGPEYNAGFTSTIITIDGVNYRQRSQNDIPLNYVFEFDNSGSSSAVNRSIEVFYRNDNTNNSVSNKQHSAKFIGTFTIFEMP